MTWTSPMTFVAGSTVTAAQLNTFLSANLLETAPAKATTAGRIFASTGANAIAEREVATATVLTSESTTSAGYTNLTTVGPTVTVTTGTQAIVGIAARMLTNGGTGIATGEPMMSFAVSGATTLAASDANGIISHAAGVAGRQSRWGAIAYVTLTAGSNTFTAKYASFTGNQASCAFQDRHLWVMAL